jgi:P4 family phage/plasmid primase-like protien
MTERENPHAETVGASRNNTTDQADTAKHNGSDALRDYLDACYGDSTGVLAVGIGREPYLTAKGKIKFKHWSNETRFTWPAEADQAVRAIVQAAAVDDVYVCPYLMATRKRGKGNSVTRMLVHADVDNGSLDTDKVRRLGGFAIASGTPGNGHAYVALSEPVSVEQHEALCRGLGAHLGAVDAKVSDNDVLRPPGTFNRKPTVTGGDPVPVVWKVPYSGSRVDPESLALQLDVNLDAASPNGKVHGKVGAGAAGGKSVNLDDYPDVAAAIEKVTGDRSVDTSRIVGASVDANLTVAQTRWCMSRRNDLQGRLDGRTDDDVLTLWIKFTEDRLAHRRAGGKAGTASQSTKSETAGASESTPTRKPGEDTYTDSGNAAALVNQYRDDFRYVPETGNWIGWDLMCWCVLPDAGAIEHAARILAARIPVPVPVPVGEAGKPLDPEAEKKRKAALAFRNRSLSKNGIVAAVRIAQADPDMRITMELLDTNAYELNTLSGIVDLTTGKLVPHNKESWHTKITGVGYDTASETRKWDEFLDTTFQGNTKLIKFMQQLAGLACIGEVTHHILPFLHGEQGNNGKSVLLNVFQAILGNYAVVLPVSALVTGRNSHTEDTADLPGARLAVCSEIGANTRWDEEKIKLHTGGDMLTARANYGHKFKYKPSHLIMIAANDRPRLDTGGKSFFRRFKLIPFTHSIPDGDPRINEHLAQELIEQEGPAILAWMVAGAVDVITNGLKPPPEVTEATDEYAESEDDVGQWIKECCNKVTETWGEPGSKLYRSYQSWCADNGIEPKTGTAFGAALGKNGFPLHRTKSLRKRMGIKLINDPDSTSNRRWEDHP